jgi:hypothetical protein
MKVIGAGLSKTGTTSLHRALQRLGLDSLHYDEQRLNDIIEGTSSATPEFRRYDDVDAVLDIPTALFFEELLDAYPDSLCILTVRDEQQWWQSIEHHFNSKSPIHCREDNQFKWQLRHLAYGSATASEFLFRKRYREHNRRVLQTVPARRLLVMDIAAGDGWESLCPFLDCPVPEFPFPHTNRRDQNERAPHEQLTVELESLVPPGQQLIWVDEFQLPWPDLDKRTIIPFLESDREYAGPPADSCQAIAACERLRTAGAGWIAFAWPAFWWLDYYREFHDHLRASFACVLHNERIIAFNLQRSQVCTTAECSPGETHVIPAGREI